MKSPIKALVATIVGIGVAGLVYVVPSELRVPVVAGAAALAFMVFSLRTRAALRSLSASINRLSQRELRQAQALTQVRDQLADSVGRVHDLGKELVAVEAASTAEILDRVASGWELLERLGDQMRHDLGRLESRSSESAADLRNKVRKDFLAAASRDFRQGEALLNLHALLRIRAPMPLSRQWAASPDLLYFLVSFVFEHRPRVILELGGGLSTLWLAYAVEKVGVGRIVSLDHDERYAAKTDALLRSHGLDSLVDVRVAPLKEIELGGEKWPWYDTTALADIRDCELLVVDGPPASTRDRARYPALPLVIDRLAAHAGVVLDDCIRTDEKEILAAWCERFPEWQVQMFNHEKGTALLTR